MLVLLIAITLLLTGMTGILALNWATFPRLRQTTRHSPFTTRPSFLLPARNEAAVIGDTVAALLAQPDAHEVIVLDDHSSDGTAEIARQAANGDPRLRVLRGADLPLGWLGKNWACHQLAAVATGDLLIFTDADVRWQAGALRAFLCEMERTGADLLTVWPTQETITAGERLVVPLMALVVHSYLPVLGVHHVPHPLFAAANGQCMGFRRAAYFAVGGHDSIRNNVLEDVTLARRVKAAGLCLRMIEGNNMVTCRMYRSWAEVRNGYAKNILKGYGNAWGLLAATLFHWTLFWGPWLLWMAGLWMRMPGWPWWPLGLGLWGIGLRAATAHRSQQRIIDAVAMPLSVGLMTLIAAQALWWQWRYGGPLWKGRVVR